MLALTSEIEPDPLQGSGPLRRAFPLQRAAEGATTRYFLRVWSFLWLLSPIP